MISMDVRLRLADKARLKKDPRTGRMMLLYPERGLELSQTAAAIAELCTGARTVREIVDAMRGVPLDLSDRLERYRSALVQIANDTRGGSAEDVIDEIQTLARETLEK